MQIFRLESVDVIEKQHRLDYGIRAGNGLGSMKEHISLFAMGEKAKKAKETQMNALDNVLKKEERPLIRLMAMFPFIRITQSKNNESKSYYSLAALLAVVGDILRCIDKDEMIGCINDLKTIP